MIKQPQNCELMTSFCTYMFPIFPERNQRSQSRNPCTIIQIFAVDAYDGDCTSQGDLIIELNFNLYQAMMGKKMEILVAILWLEDIVIVKI